MKKYITDKFLTLIKKNYNYNESKMLELKYGIETLYVTLTKTIVILSISFILGTLKQLILLLIFYSIIRLTGFGMHAKKSWQCWVSSIIIFLGLPYLTNIIHLSNIVKLITVCIAIPLIILYAPADTEKKPIINKKRRLFFKIITSLIALIYSILIFTINNNLLINSIYFALILETIMILPITYKVFNLSYNNYKKYNLSFCSIE